MTFFWRKNFWQEDPEHPGESEHYLVDCNLMVGGGVSPKLPAKCDICPCGDLGWYIVTVCSCGNCATEYNPIVGDSVLSGSEAVTVSYGGETYPLRAVHLDDQTYRDATGSGYIGEQFRTLKCPLNHVMLAIEHETPNAPDYPGYMNVCVWYDGDLLTEWDGTPYVPGERMYIGSGVSGASEQTGHLGVNLVFSDGGSHTLDMRVLFFGYGDEPQTGYTIRRYVHVGPEENTLEAIGDVAIVHGSHLFDDCGDNTSMKLEWPVLGTLVDSHMVVLKGPFDTQADADYVLNQWEDLIKAYAQTCVCEGNCPGDWFKVEGAESGYLTHWTGGDGESGAYCEYGWVYYNAFPNQELYDAVGITVTPVFYTYPDGEEVSAPWEGVLPPCWTLLFKVNTSETIYFSEYEEYDFGLAGDWGSLEPSTLCVLNDEESEYYEDIWEYNESTGEGIPGNSYQLELYKAGLEV